MKYSLFVLSFLLTTISCDNSTGPEIEPLVVQVAEDVIADPAVIGPDGRPAGSGRYTLYSLSENKIILSSEETDAAVRQADSASSKWDIGFNATTIIINGGSSGPGQGVAQVLTEAFQDVVTAPETGYHADGANQTCPGVQTPAGTFPGAPYAICTGSGHGWYNYDSNGPLITPIAGRTLVVRTAAEGNYAKVRILSYYKGSPFDPDPLADESRYYTFEYVLQPDGSRNLSLE